MATARDSNDSLHTSTIYQLFLRAFTPEGTFNAAAKLLPHLAEIGIDIVYLCPIALADDDMDKAHWSSRQIKSGIENPCNPYRIKDYYCIDPEYGTEEDFIAFVKIAHQLGLSVMLDLVYFHCGPQASFLKEHPDFIRRDAKGNPDCGEWRFPKLNFDNQELREHLIQNMEFLVVHYGIDGFRCDVGSKIPLDFWEEARYRLEDFNPDIVLLNEGCNPPYMENAFDLSYCFAWSTTVTNIFDKKQPATALRELWTKLHNEFPAGARFIRCTDNHDIANDDYENRLEARLPQDATDAMLLLNFTIDGVPFIYNGQEIADANRHSIYGNRFHSHNLCIDWAKYLTTDGQARLELFKKLTELRHECTPLAEGDTLWVDNSTPDQLISFLRMPNAFNDDDCDCDDDDCGCNDDDCGCNDDDCDCNDDDCGCDDDDCGCEDHECTSSALVVVNASDKPVASTIDLGLERGTLLNVRMQKNATYKPNDDHLDVCLLPYGYLVLEF